MDIDLLVVADCPNEAPGRRTAAIRARPLRLRTQGFQITVVGDEHEAAARGFTGAPTFLINGSDPFANDTQPTGLTCRLYPQPSGPPSGLPTLDHLRSALATAARETAPTSGLRHD